jgi:hypothetical protein
MKTPFARLAAWRHALRGPGLGRTRTDVEAQSRWEGEGGNNEIAGAPAVMPARPIDATKKATKS